MTETYTIKPLEWVEECSWLNAKTPFGMLCVFRSYMKQSFKARFDSMDTMTWIGGDFDSEESAKAACEQHWHDTIKQALEES